MFRVRVGGVVLFCDLYASDSSVRGKECVCGDQLRFCLAPVIIMRVAHVQGKHSVALLPLLHPPTLLPLLHLEPLSPLLLLSPPHGRGSRGGRGSRYIRRNTGNGATGNRGSTGNNGDRGGGKQRQGHQR